MRKSSSPYKAGHVTRQQRVPGVDVKEYFYVVDRDWLQKLSLVVPYGRYADAHGISCVGSGPRRTRAPMTP
jgi:hypothetical protein